MSTVGISPTGIERTFGEDEIIVSKTDIRGRITYANDVFLRVAKYDEDEVLGKPHNIIRHPDMPRAVFALLWETISSGDEIFAYVKNLASDGAHYWVHAHVTPSFSDDGSIVGYHSNRRLPEQAAVKVVDQLYHHLREEEVRCSDPVRALAASRELLERTLRNAKVSYDQFVWTIGDREVMVG